MKTTVEQVADVELHGYLDGELAEQRIGTIENHLTQDQAAAERIEHYGLQGDLIRRLYGPLISRPLPSQMAGRFQFMNEKTSKGRSRKRKFFLFLLLLLIAATLAAGLMGFLPPFLKEWTSPAVTFFKS